MHRWIMYCDLAQPLNSALAHEKFEEIDPLYPFYEE